MFEGREPIRGSRPSHLSGATIRTRCESCDALREHDMAQRTPDKSLAPLVLVCRTCGNERGTGDKR